MTVYRTIKIAALAACMSALLFASEASAATPLTIGGGWAPFGFGGVKSSFDTSFTFTGPGLFKVTDAYLDGDQFDIAINGIDKGPTSVPVNDGTQINGDFDAAFASGKFSHASFLLGPGSYEVTGTVLLSPYGGGGAAAELVAGGVPEPATWAMLLMGFFGLGSVLRATRQKTLAVNA